MTASCKALALARQRDFFCHLARGRAFHRKRLHVADRSVFLGNEVFIPHGDFDVSIEGAWNRNG